MAARQLAGSQTAARRQLSVRARLLLGAGGAALIAAAILVAVTAGGGGHRAHVAGKPPPPARLPAMREAYANPAMGASGLLPAGWLAVKGPGLLRLSDRSANVVIEIVALAAGPRTPLLGRALAVLRRAYGKLTIRAGNGSRLGGLPARSVVVYARNRHHVALRILLAVAQAPGRAYVVEAITTRSATLTELVESQEALNLLRLRR